MSDENTNTCVECNERPALALPKKQGRMHDTCAVCLAVLKEAGVDILKPKPKESKRAAKKQERQHKLEVIEQRAQRKKQQNQPAEPVEA